MVEYICNIMFYLQYLNNIPLLEMMSEAKGKRLGTLRCRGLKPPVVRGYQQLSGTGSTPLATLDHTAKPLKDRRSFLKEIQWIHLVYYFFSPFLSLAIQT